MERASKAAGDTVHHPLFARFWARMSVAADHRAGVAAHREELLAGLRGEVVEIGAGNGLNFARYPAGVARVLAVEPERTLRDAALTAAARAQVPVRVVPGTAEALPAGDGEFDAAVASLVLCTVRDLPRSLAELHRVLRPGGELRFFEHGLAPTPGAARVQRVVDATVWPRLFGGCHTARDTLAAIGAAGFELGAYRRLQVPAGGVPLPSSPCVIGVARRRADG
ncbi:class I SAM-dependent methyltransferase [Streptomyces genisteinicus]|uniref:Class I SAM-dependent methyltransferase n=1 Tax=Streptomyces genisteinicus TaxID=2768068 RepID=A0A7H0HNM6_9ACTN|nr:class I SAM-dependent methyltransferase [Streptomyces genisteinicus]QNP62142.1 class I SAM-dependent methyltransferase [Streptomyces genisteinicus]